MKLWKVAVVLATVAMFSVSANAQDTCGTAVAPGTPVDPCSDAAVDDEGASAGSSCAGGTLDSWVTFVATSATHRIRTDIASAGTDSEIGIYIGGCGGLTEVACNNDECFTGLHFCPDEHCNGDSAGPWMSAECTSGLTIGATYHVRVTTFGDFCPNGPYTVTVEGDGNVCGDGELACDGSEECEVDSHCSDSGGTCVGCVCVAQCPSTCATAVDVGNGSNCGAGAFVGSTLVDPCCDTDPTGPLGSCTSGGGLNDLWLTFVATSSGTRVRSDLTSIGTDSDYIVYSGGCGALTEVGCSEDEAAYLGDINIVGLTVGDTYHIQLGGWQDTCGPFGIVVQGIAGAECGDNIWAPIVGEECDGDDAIVCPTLCTIDCTCPVPICGNGVKEEGEQCDLGALNGEVGCQPVDCDCTGDCKTPSDIVPAISEWGLVVMVLIGLVAGTVMFGRKRVATA